ncbi:uncharacterized protein LOC112560899 isoform X2 [Pomacea canaliculata]|nr:uncharacterized protein LOC112560899 isoform X2 [Pomacea canaliculata]XP_025088797.1 uncharacterized protein LOC112560899 isoform X2 [Pomacea canaliculata]
MATVLTAGLALLLLLSVHVSLTSVMAAPTQWTGDRVQVHPTYNEAGDFLSLVQNIMNRLQADKQKRTSPDGGFFSRHDAMRDYLNSIYASELASDPYGPGKR